MLSVLLPPGGGGDRYQVFFHLLSSPVFYVAMVGVPCVLMLVDVICSSIDVVGRFKCLKPVNVPAIVSQNPRPQVDYVTAAQERAAEKAEAAAPAGDDGGGGDHGTAVWTGDGDVDDRGPAPGAASSSKSAAVLQAEAKRRRSPVWQQDLSASVFVVEDQLVRCYLVLFALLLSVGLVAIVASSNVYTVQVQYGGVNGSLPTHPRPSLFPENGLHLYAGDFDSLNTSGSGDSGGGTTRNTNGHARCLGLASELGITPGILQDQQYDEQAEGGYSGGEGVAYPPNAVVCDVNVTLPTDMVAPVKVMYRLTRFWQNYQIYIADYDEEEMKGDHLADDRNARPKCR